MSHLFADGWLMGSGVVSCGIYRAAMRWCGHVYGNSCLVVVGGVGGAPTCVEMPLYRGCRIKEEMIKYIYISRASFVTVVIYVLR